MRKLILLFWILANAVLLTNAQKTSIKIECKELADSSLQLAYYYANQQYIALNATFDHRGKAEFTADKPLQGGLYLVILPQRKYFDMLLTDDQDFTLSFDSRNIVESMKVKGSHENELFFNYQMALMKKMEARDALNEQLTDELTDIERKSIENELEKLANQAQELWQQMAAENPNTFFANLITAMNGDGGAYFDHLDYSDERLLYTPVFYQSMQRLLARNVNNIKHYKSIIADLDSFIVRTEQNEKINQYVLSYLLQFFSDYQKIGLNMVFGHLAEKYWLTDRVDWLKEEHKETIRKRADKWTAAAEGKIAPDLKMADMTGDSISLYDFGGNYKLLFFWTAGCGHCKSAAKYIVEFKKEKLQSNISVFSVYTKANRSEWEKFLVTHEMDDVLINVWDAENNSDFQNLYYVVSTPIAYFLTPDNKVLSVRYGDEPIRDLLEQIKSQID